MRLVLILIMSALVQYLPAQKLRVVVAGIDHGHVGWILSRHQDPLLDLVGVYSADTVLAKRYAKQYGFSEKLIYADLGKMLDAVRPEAALAFGSVHSHLSVVEAAAPRGIHVMVEKPLAVSLDHAQKMQALAKKHQIHLLTNFETSWYASAAKAYELVNDSAAVGTVRKVVVSSGHPGPKEIGCSPEFLAWLTDPVLNGGGAVMDFGCYGANIMTRLMRGERPTAVTAVTRQLKPQIYPKVDDDATIMVEYKTAHCIIQASWNWPYHIKGMEIYGNKGFLLAPDGKTLNRGTDRLDKTERVNTTEVPHYEDPFLYLHDVIRGKLKPRDYDVYSLENNMLVMEILEKAKQSARSGKRIPF